MQPPKFPAKNWVVDATLKCLQVNSKSTYTIYENEHKKLLYSLKRVKI